MAPESHEQPKRSSSREKYLQRKRDYGDAYRKTEGAKTKLREFTEKRKIERKEALSATERAIKAGKELHRNP